MERGAIGKLIPRHGETENLRWFTGFDHFGEDITAIFLSTGERIAMFYGPELIRLERVALFLTTEQS